MSESIWPFLTGRQPLSIDRAEGAYLYLSDGRRVLDAAGGAIVSNIGHGRVEVADRVRDALVNCSYVIPTWLTPEREALVNELRDHWLPPHLSRIHLACGGSEANEAAMKIAVQYQAAKGYKNRHIVLARSVSYHGTTISTAGVSGHPARKKGLEGLLNEHPRIETPYPLRCPEPDATAYYLRNLEETIESIGADSIAALIAEPMNGSSGGAIMPPDDYWPEAQKILKRHGILLVIDEVMTGFGRTGFKFGCDAFGIEADLMVAGKGMAGGYAAISGVYGRKEIADTIAGAGLEVMFHTFGALPQGCAAATAVLQIMRRENLVERSAQTGATLLARLQEKFGGHPHIAEIRGKGMLIGIEMVANRDTLERFPPDSKTTDKVVAAAMDKGVFFYPGGTGEIRDILCIGPALTIGEEQIEEIVTALEYGLAAIG